MTDSSNTPTLRRTPREPQLPSSLHDLRTVFTYTAYFFLAVAVLAAIATWNPFTAVPVVIVAAFAGSLAALVSFFLPKEDDEDEDDASEDARADG